MRVSSLLLPLLAACTSGTVVEGTIDGEEVDVQSGIFVQDRGYFGSDEGQVRIIISDVGDPCNAYSEWYAVLLDIDLADVFTGDLDYVEEIWAEEFPEDFWDGEIQMRVNDPRDDLTGEELEGLGQGELMDDDGTARGWLTHYTDHQTISDLVTGDDQQRYPFDGGTLLIAEHEPGERISGEYATTIVNSDDDEEEIVVSFDAERCEELEDVLENTNDSADDAPWWEDWDTGDWGGWDE